jgi:hypothetical protein
MPNLVRVYLAHNLTPGQVFPFMFEVLPSITVRDIGVMLLEQNEICPRELKDTTHFNYVRILDNGTYLDPGMTISQHMKKINTTNECVLTFETLTIFE